MTKMDHEIFTAENASTKEEENIASMSKFICRVFKNEEAEQVSSALMSAMIFLIWKSAEDFDAAIEETLDGIRNMAEIYKADDERKKTGAALQ